MIVKGFVKEDMFLKKGDTVSIEDVNFRAIPAIKRVIFNAPTTIVYWKDETKTVVRCADGEQFNEEVGVAMAIVKKLYGNRSEFVRIVESAYRQPQYEKTKKSKE